MFNFFSTAAVTDHCDVVVRVGDEVTLSCGNVTDDQDKCNAATWLFTGSSHTIAITLFEHGDIHKNAKTKSHRLSVTANCSLVIRNVSAEDVGQYNCRKFSKSEKIQDRDIPVFLSLVNSKYFHHNVFSSSFPSEQHKFNEVQTVVLLSSVLTSDCT